MAVSFFLAKIWGVYLTSIALSLLLRPKNIDLLFDSVKNKAFVYISGAVLVGLGTFFVLIHPGWPGDWRVIITILGWMTFLKGAIRIFFPEFPQKFIKPFRKPVVVYPLLLITLAVGIYLFYIGFMGPVMEAAL